MRYLKKGFLIASFLCAFNAYSDSIINAEKDISSELRGIFSEVGIKIPAKAKLLEMLEEKFNGAPNFNEKDLEKIRQEFSIDVRLNEEKCAEIINNLKIPRLEYFKEILWRKIP